MPRIRALAATGKHGILRRRIRRRRIRTLRIRALQIRANSTIRLAPPDPAETAAHPMATSFPKEASAVAVAVVAAEQRVMKHQWVETIMGAVAAAVAAAAEAAVVAAVGAAVGAGAAAVEVRVVAVTQGRVVRAMETGEEGRATAEADSCPSRGT